jgi:hypothetical protein
MKKDNEENIGFGIDFGADDGIVPSADPAFDAWVGRMAPSLNAPKKVPSLEMWREIEAARRTQLDAQAGRIAGVTPLRLRRWPLAAVIAAAVLLGVAIDRLYLRTADGPPATTMAAGPGMQEEASDPSRLYRMAAAQTLTQAEALLTAYRAADGPARDPAVAPQLGRWGREILGSTRLLMDSPGGDDPQLRALLDDLELVLVQIIQLSGDPLEAADRALIDRALHERNLLPRIRTAVPAGAPAVAEAVSGE